MFHAIVAVVIGMQVLMVNDTVESPNGFETREACEVRATELAKLVPPWLRRNHNLPDEVEIAASGKCITRDELDVMLGNKPADRGA